MNLVNLDVEKLVIELEKLTDENDQFNEITLEDLFQKIGLIDDDLFDTLGLLEDLGFVKHVGYDGPSDCPDMFIVFQFVRSRYDHCFS